ncbi:MAG: RidA family protein [Alphaproteobacteria bacterium]|nr:RidA family protein [Alphaproteobacteria bacterium]
MDIEARLRELDITLPAPPTPVAAYVPFTISGKLVHIAGQLPLADGVLTCKGRLDGNITVEDGQAAARLCAINVVAQLKAACGDLNSVARCLKLNVFIAATADFTRQPEVANGASELIGAVFGEAGKHARSSVGVASLPRGAAVEVDAMFELK